MRSRFVYFGSLLGVALATSDCAMRVGSGGPPPTGDEAKGEVFGPSACARVGNETKLAFGTGSASFAFAWAGDHYVVVYPDAASGNLFVGMLAQDGTALGSPTVVQAALPDSDLPNVVKTSSGFLVVWQAGAAGHAVFAHALASDGSPSGEGVSVATTQLQQPRPVLAPAGDKVAVAWMDQFDDGSRGVAIATIDPTTMQATAPQRAAQGDIDGYPWLAASGQTIGLVWTDQSTASNGQPSYDLGFARLDPQSLQPSAPMSLRGRALTGVSQPRVIGTDFGFLAAWEDFRGSDNQIFMTLVDPSGAPIAGGLVPEPNTGDANWPNAAWSGTSTGIVYYQWRDSRPQVFISFVDRTGVRVGGLHDLQVSNGTSGWSKFPQVVWTGNEFAVVYVDNRSGGPELWFQRISCQSSGK
jgi:hypothetical protein